MFNNTANDNDAAVPAPITQELNIRPPTGQPYKLTFFYENEEKVRESQGNFDGLIVQSYNGSAETMGTKAIRYGKDFGEHGTGCMLSAFLYFVTITSFVYLGVLWIKQRMHMHIEQMQWW